MDSSSRRSVVQSGSGALLTLRATPCWLVTVRRTAGRTAFPRGAAQTELSARSCLSALSLASGAEPLDSTAIELSAQRATRPARTNLTAALVRTHAIQQPR